LCFLIVNYFFIRINTNSENFLTENFETSTENFNRNINRKLRNTYTLIISVALQNKARFVYPSLWVITMKFLNSDFLHWKSNVHCKYCSQQHIVFPFDPASTYRSIFKPRLLINFIKNANTYTQSTCTAHIKTQISCVCIALLQN
jgi:hypothetical protein